MKRLAAVFVLSSLTGCTAHRQPAPPPPKDIIADPFPAEQGEVEKTLHDLLEAAREKDVDRLLAFIADSPKVTKFDDSEPLDRQDVIAWKKAERQAFSSFKLFTPAISDLRVDVFGAVAVATFVLKYDIETDKDKLSAKARSTFVFAKDAARWKIVHAHFSAFKSNL